MTNMLKRSQVAVRCWKGDAVSPGHVKEEHRPSPSAAAPALLPPAASLCWQNLFP